MLVITTETANGKSARDDNGYEGWPGIVSRFQLIILAGRRSKQLYRGARPRIPADPLKRRNTSIALEELRLGLVSFRLDNGHAEPQTPVASIDTLANMADLDVSKVEQGNEGS